MFSWRKKIKFQQVFLLAVISLAIFLRFYNLKNSLMFQGDQGRDAMVVSQIFKNLDPVFIGPVTSIGNMYLGPFYYYFMLPFLFLSYPSPIGPVYAVAALSVLTIFLLFHITKKVFSLKAAYLTTIFFTLSAGAVNLARFSWNPNIAPFFSLLMFYFTYLAWKKDTRYWLLVSVCFSVLIQLHYVTLLAISGAGLIFLGQLIEKIKLHGKKLLQQEKNFLRNTLLAIVIFILSLTPLILFDFKHGLVNAKSFTSILTEKESFDLERKNGRTGFTAVSQFFVTDLKQRASQVLFEPSFGVNKANHPLLFGLLILTVFYLIKNKKNIQDGEVIILAYLVPGIIGVSLYQHEVYEHYIAYLFPFIYIFYGIFFAKFKNNFAMWILLLPFLIFFIINNASRYFIKSNSWTIDDMRRTSEQIYQRVDPGEKYNLVLLSESKDLYGMNYRYFLSTNPNAPVKMEDHHLATKLFVINEEKKETDIPNLLIYEIVVFPNKNIEEVFQIENGPEITVLTSYNE